MELDELKSSWAALDRKLEHSFALERQRLARDTAEAARRAVLRGWCGRLAEMAVGAGVAAASIQVVADHLDSLRYLLLGGAVAALALFSTIATGVLWIRARALEPAGGVVAIQYALERLRRFEFRTLKWVFALGVLLWLPALLVVFECLTGFDALARVSLRYLAANLAFGVAAVLVVFRLAWRYVERDFESAAARKVVDALTGSGFRRAEAHIRELDEFQGESGCVSQVANK